MEKINKKFAIFSFIFLIVGLAAAFPAAEARAQNSDPGFVSDVLGGRALIPEACKGDANGCGIKEFIILLINIFQLMLGVIGSLALFFFVYGGFMWILSRGNPQMIQKGKDIITGAVIGVTVVMGSWFLINFILALLTGTSFGETVNIFNNPWFAPLDN